MSGGALVTKFKEDVAVTQRKREDNLRPFSPLAMPDQNSRMIVGTGVQGKRFFFITVA
jgi:hypothetical protein